MFLRSHSRLRRHFLGFTPAVNGVAKHEALSDAVATPHLILPPFCPAHRPPPTNYSNSFETRTQLCHSESARSASCRKQPGFSAYRAHHRLPLLAHRLVQLVLTMKSSFRRLPQLLLGDCSLSPPGTSQPAAPSSRSDQDILAFRRWKQMNAPMFST